ncbi:MAG: squalene--hopene cyclase, partial [bacterium]|nr:squalene--hopene cyclase [bacterium]
MDGDGLAGYDGGGRAQRPSRRGPTAEERARGRALQSALSAAVEWLLERQDAAGWWSGELETNVTMTAEHVLLSRFLGVSLEG